MSEELGYGGEVTRTVLQYQASRKMRELMRCHVDADPVCQHCPNLLRQPVRAFVFRSNQE